MKIFDIDRSLIDVAARNSAPLATREAARLSASSWIASLPLDEKDDILVGLLSDETETAATLRRRFAREWHLRFSFRYL